ncbi:MAG: hypothetical protein QOG30_384, partial [Acidimicrobiaceae bacterium]
MDGTSSGPRRCPYHAAVVGQATPVYEVFGLRIAPGFALEELSAVTTFGVADVQLTLASATSVRDAFSGSLPTQWIRESLLGDGCRYRVERGSAGDYAVEYGDRATFHLSAD